MEKKKILFVITKGPTGGAQRYVFDLATNLGPNFEVTVAVGEPNGPRDLQDKLKINNKQLTNKIKIIQLKHLVRPISPFRDILAIFELSNLYKREKFDIVHLNSSKAGIIGSLAKLLIAHCSLLIVYTVHGWVFNSPMSSLKQALYIFLEKQTAKLKNEIIVLSDADKQTAKKIKIPAEKIIKIPLGIASVQILDKEAAKKEILKRANIPTQNKWVVTIANFFQTKGLDILINAVNLEKENLKNAQFIIIGDGSRRKELEYKISKYNLQNQIHLLGYMNEAARLLSAFDLMVIPSRKEGLPYAALEAISVGLPILATKVGGLPEIIDDETMLTTPNDAAKLGQKITDTLSRPLSTEGKSFPLSKMLNETITVYRLPRPKQS